MEGVESVFMVSGRCLEGVWKVIGSFLDQLEIQSIEYSKLGFYYDQNENFYLELECGPAQSYLFQNLIRLPKNKGVHSTSLYLLLAEVLK